MNAQTQRLSEASVSSGHRRNFTTLLWFSLVLCHIQVTVGLGCIHLALLRSMVRFLFYSPCHPAFLFAPWLPFFPQIKTGKPSSSPGSSYPRCACSR